MLDLSSIATMTPLSTTNNREPPSEDLYALLESKEQDLYLAAELGKALLEKNEQLARQSERMVEEYQQKIDILEQEKHALRRKLVSAESEAEMKVAELLQDLQQIRNTNEQREKTLKQTEREKAEMVSTLEAHSQRLSLQLEQSTKVEEELTLQLQQLRDQCNVSKSSLQDHVTSLEMLNHEMSLLSERKTELERRSQRLKEERDEMAVNYQEAIDRISALEHTLREQNVQMLHSANEVESLRASNIDLEESLQRLNNSLNNSNSGRRSLRLEIEGIENEDEEAQFKREILDAYNQLRLICDRLKVTRTFGGNSLNSEDASISVEEIQYHQVQVGLLSSIVTELTSLLTETLSLDDNSEAFTTNHTREALERSQRALASAEERAIHMQEEIRSLESQLLMKQEELKAASEERDRARADLAPGSFQDQLAEARQIRDQAVARRNEAEIALAAARLETVQASSQLMEAIRQKVELSEQLEQWQMDMQSLLDEQMRHKLTKQERARKMLLQQQEQRHQQNSPSIGNTAGKRLLSLFSR